MSDAPEHSLRQRLDALEARQRLNAAADEALELAQRDRLPLDHTLRSLLPLLVAHTGAECAWIRTYNEDLELRDYIYPEGARLPLEPDVIAELADRGQRVARGVPGGYVVGQRLDVAGESFGAAALAFGERLMPARVKLADVLLETWCEELDNYLAAIAQSRRKHATTRALSEALREPVLGEGVDRALAALREAVPFDDMLLVFRHEEDGGKASLSYKIVQKGEVTHDSSSPDMEVDEFIRTRAAPLIEGTSRDLLERFGMSAGREEVLISGVRDARVMGRLVVTSENGDFNTYDRDLLERFADYLRQRIVDFNRQWKRLSSIFARSDVRRLLGEERYLERLAPRVADVGILFCDISGFTRISEQVLVDPRRIGNLIDVWGQAVVDIIWEHGGCFDKMVGDCVIALWGPPFFESSAKVRCGSALEAAAQIRDYTRSLNDGVFFPELKAMSAPIGVASGVSYGSVCCGIFGPDEDYTGFSSAMNNTARLQGVAVRDEILCMDSLVAILGDECFGPLREAEVKNVAAPLRFRAYEE